MPAKTATPAITIEHLNPADIHVEANIRRTVKTDRTFWSTIKQDGVVVPVIVEKRDDGYHLIDGQRRTLAAVDAGLTTIPAVVIDPLADDAGRIIRQLVVNEHREQLTDADRTAAFQTLFELNVSADQIARKTKTPKARVETALKVAASTHVSAAVAEKNVPLDLAAEILEFDDDPAIASELAQAAATDPGRFAHLIEQRRQERDEKVVIDAALAELEKAGARVIDRFDRWDHKGPEKYLDELAATAEDAAQYARLEADKHESCPGHAVTIRVGYDWRGDGDRTPIAEISPVCTDWKANGHFVRGRAKASAGGAIDEDEKARRKLARENNKAWSTATVVRIQFVKDLLAEKEPPAGWEGFVAHFLARGGVDDYRIQGTVRQLLDINSDRLTWLKQNPTRAAHLCLAHAIAAIEGQHEYAKKGWDHSLTPDYLKWLSGWGYTLADVEEAAKVSKAKKS